MLVCPSRAFNQLEFVAAAPENRWLILTPLLCDILTLSQMPAFYFSSKENIVAQTQVWPFEKVNEAIAAFREGKPCYRYVSTRITGLIT